MRLGMAVALGISPTLSDIDARALLDALDDVRAELARSRKVVQAATAYIDECESPAPDLTYRAQLRRALAAEVATLSDTEGSGTDA